MPKAPFIDAAGSFASRQRREKARGARKPRIDARPVSAVLLVDDLHNGRIFRRVFVRDLGSIILCGTVVNQDDLRLFPGCQQCIDAMTHILCRIITRYSKCYKFFHSFPLSSATEQTAADATILSRRTNAAGLKICGIIIYAEKGNFK